MTVGRRIVLRPRFAMIACCVCIAGCGGASADHGRSAAAGAALQPSQRPAEAPSDAQSAATGDIPDNQTFLTFTDPTAGYSIRYPEGWTRTSGHGEVTFQDRANLIHVAVSAGVAPTPAQASAAVAQMKTTDPTIVAGAPVRVRIGASSAVKLTYTRLSKRDPITGKRLPIVIDRYEYAHGGKTAIIDLGTAKGVDNVDAYRMISRSFRWR